MDRSKDGKPPRSRGRPPKVKRGGRPPTGASPLAPSTQAESSNGSFLDSAGGSQHEASSTIMETSNTIDYETGTTTPISSKRSSPETDEYVQPAKRSRTGSSLNGQTIASQSAPSKRHRASSVTSDRKAKAMILPARRSTRHATVQATQISEGTLRPPGPPNLEAALSIALRNLESEMWRYLWSHHRKNPNGPLPTPAAVKEACPRARAAAEAVDKADRELEEAIDEIMLSNSKKKGRSGTRAARLVTQSGAGTNSEIGTPETSIGRSGSLLVPEKEAGITTAKTAVPGDTPNS